MLKICPKCNTTHDKKGVFCCRSCSNSRMWSEEDKLRKSISAKNSIKVLNNNKRMGTERVIGNIHKRQKDPDNWETSFCIVCNKEFLKLKKNKRKTCSSKCAKQIRGGLRKNSGVSKSGWYKGFWLNSTYEIAYVYFHMKKEIPIKRCNDFYKYKDPKSGQIRKYYPDFIVNNQIIEIKGYHTHLVDIKAATCNAKILYKDDLQHIFDFVEKDSGIKIKDLYKLYEKKK